MDYIETCSIISPKTIPFDWQTFLIVLACTMGVVIAGVFFLVFKRNQQVKPPQKRLLANEAENDRV